MQDGYRERGVVELRDKADQGPKPAFLKSSSPVFLSVGAAVADKAERVDKQHRYQVVAFQNIEEEIEDAGVANRETPCLCDRVSELVERLRDAAVKDSSSTAGIQHMETGAKVCATGLGIGVMEGRRGGAWLTIPAAISQMLGQDSQPRPSGAPCSDTSIQDGEQELGPALAEVIFVGNGGGIAPVLLEQRFELPRSHGAHVLGLHREFAVMTGITLGVCSER